jgi:Sugar (and other) transporter.
MIFCLAEIFTRWIFCAKYCYGTVSLCYVELSNYSAIFILFPASLSSITTPIGCILSGYLMDLIGRKRTLIITEIPLILGWILISTSRAVETIYVGRLLVGLGSGMVGAPARVYTGEGVFISMMHFENGLA